MSFQRTFLKAFTLCRAESIFKRGSDGKIQISTVVGCGFPTTIQPPKGVSVVWILPAVRD